MKDLRQQLEELLRGRVRLMGLGNVDYGDDGFGVRLAEELLANGVPDVVVAGASPDRYIGSAADEGFDRLVFLDAVDFGAAPGSVVFLDARQISTRYPQVSTHKISLGVLARWIEASGQTRVVLIGVQPESMKAGQELTPTMYATLGILRDLLFEVTTGASFAAANRGRYPSEDSRDGSKAPSREAETTVC